MVAVRYFVAYVDRSLEFYSRLGFELDERWGPPFAIVIREGLELWLSGPGASASKPMPDGAIPSPGGFNRMFIAFNNLDSLVSDLRESGVPFRNEPISGPGGTQVLVDDPDGNPIEIFEPR